MEEWKIPHSLGPAYPSGCSLAKWQLRFLTSWAGVVWASLSSRAQPWEDARCYSQNPWDTCHFCLLQIWTWSGEFTPFPPVLWCGCELEAQHNLSPLHWAPRTFLRCYHQSFWLGNIKFLLLWYCLAIKISFFSEYQRPEQPGYLTQALFRP